MKKKKETKISNVHTHTFKKHLKSHKLGMVRWPTPAIPAFGRQGRGDQELQSLEQWKGFLDAQPETALTNNEGRSGPPLAVV